MKGADESLKDLVQPYAPLACNETAGEDKSPVQMQMVKRAGKQRGRGKRPPKMKRNVGEPVYGELVFGVGRCGLKSCRDGVQGSGSMARSVV